MSHLSVRQAFGLSCPSGGNFYACGAGPRFVGCCNSVPCLDGCPAGDLEPASFNSAYSGEFPAQECNSGSSWYTCANTTPPFMGCCESNPCNDGCPAANLTAGILSTDLASAAPFLGSAAAVSSSTAAAGPTSMPIIPFFPSYTSSPPNTVTETVTAITSNTAASRSPSQTTIPQAAATSSATAGQTTSSQSVPIGAIAGGATASAAIIAIILGILLYYCRRKPTSEEPLVENRIANFIEPSSSVVEILPKESRFSPYLDPSANSPLPDYRPRSPPPSDPNIHFPSPGQDAYINFEPALSSQSTFASGLNINNVSPISPLQSSLPPFSPHMSMAAQSELSAGDDTARSLFELGGSFGAGGDRSSQRLGRGSGRQEWGYEENLRSPV